MLYSTTIQSNTNIKLVKVPAFRKIRAYSFDPSLSLKIDTAAINNISYKIQWENLKPGPIGEYLEVIDFDPTTNLFYKPVDLNDRYVIAQEGLDPSESNPQFHQQMVYAVAMTTIRNFEAALGRKILWASRRLIDNTVFEEFVPRLRIYPHALRDANAFYSPLKKALLFGYFSSEPADETLLMPESLVFTCLSHDIIAHETTHAILDGMHYYYNDPTNADVLAFHEAFADIVALFQHFTFPEVLKHQIAKTRGDLASQNILGELAQQFGSAIGGYGSLRDAIGERDSITGEWRPKEPDADDYRELIEPHSRGSILVAAVFEAFLSIYKARIADLLRLASGGSGIIPQGELHPDLVNRLANEASKAANHVLNMCIRALDYCPPVDITFGDYLRAIITADVDLVPDDRRNYRLAFIDAFRRRGVYPEAIKTLSVESLQLKTLNIGVSEENHQQIIQLDETNSYSLDGGGTRNIPEVDEDTAQLLGILNNFLRDYAYAIKYVNKRSEIYQITKEYIGGTKVGVREALQGLHNRINMKFSASSDFARLTGLAFIANPQHIGVRNSERYSGPSFQIQNLRLVNRIGPDGTQINHVVFSIVQPSGVKFRDGKFVGHFLLSPSGPQNEEATMDDAVQFAFRGGCTLIFDLDTLKLKYAATKPLLDLENWNLNSAPKIDEKRLLRQFEFKNSAQAFGSNAYSLYFGEKLYNLSEPFSFLHQH